MLEEKRNVSTDILRDPPLEYKCSRTQESSDIDFVSCNPTRWESIQLKIKRWKSGRPSEVTDLRSKGSKRAGYHSVTYEMSTQVMGIDLRLNPSLFCLPLHGVRFSRF